MDNIYPYTDICCGPISPIIIIIIISQILMVRVTLNHQYCGYHVGKRKLSEEVDQSGKFRKPGEDTLMPYHDNNSQHLSDIKHPFKIVINY